MFVSLFETKQDKVSLLEIIIPLLLFIFMITHASYLKGLLFPITLFSLPFLLACLIPLVFKNLNRSNWELFLIIAFLFFYVGLKIIRGMKGIGAEGDRDDALYQSVKFLLQGVYPYDKLTFLNNLVTTGPASIILSIPFVKFFNSIQILSIAAISFLAVYYWRYIGQKTERNFLSIFLALMIFLPFMNWEYWESGEELLYGFPLIYLSVILLTSEDSRYKTLKYLFTGFLLGTSLMIRINYVIPILIILFLLLINRNKEVFLSVLVMILTIIIYMFPFLLLNKHHFIFSFIKYLWLASHGKYPFEALIGIFICVFLVYVYGLRKLTLLRQLHILIALTLFSLYAVTGWATISWHAMFWFIPLIISLPFFLEQ